MTYRTPDRVASMLFVALACCLFAFGCSDDDGMNEDAVVDADMPGDGRSGDATDDEGDAVGDAGADEDVGSDEDTSSGMDADSEMDAGTPEDGGGEPDGDTADGSSMSDAAMDVDTTVSSDGENSMDARTADTGVSPSDCGDNEVYVSNACLACGPLGGCPVQGPQCRDKCEDNSECSPPAATCDQNEGHCERACL